MSMKKLSPEQVFADADAVAAVVAASEVFGFVKRTLDLPLQWAARVTDGSGDHRVVEAGGVVDGCDAEEILLARSTPIEVEIQQEGIGTADGFLGRTRVFLRIALICEGGELDAFSRKVLGSARFATTSTMVQHLEPCVRQAMSKFAASHEASALTDGSQADALKRAVAEAVEGTCFEAGLKLFDEPRVRFESEAFRQVRAAKQDAVRRREEHEAAQGLRDAIHRAREDHLDRLSDTLSRLKELADESPDADLPDLMRTFAEHERSDLYEALFASQAALGRTQLVVVATAHQLLYFDPVALSEPARRLDIEGEAGPIRSVQRVRHGLAARDITGWKPAPHSPAPQEGDASGRLLLGAATGVYVMSPEASAPEQTYLVEGSPSVRGGFNAVALSGDRLFATHSELGIFRWRLAEPDASEPLFSSMTRQAKAIRAVRCHNGDAYCAVDDRIIAWPVDGSADRPADIYSGSGATLTALCACEAGVFAGNSDGQILRWSGATGGLSASARAGKLPVAPEVLHGGSRRGVESVWVVSTGGVRRLFYTDTSLCVYSRVLGDTFTCRYEASGQTLRRVEVGPDLLAATNDLRDRLLYWTPGKPQQPRALTEVGRLTGHSVQDVCLVTQV